ARAGVRDPAARPGPGRGDRRAGDGALGDARRPRAGLVAAPLGARNSVSTLAQPQRALLQRVARRAMLQHGLEPDFTPAALAEAAALHEPSANDEGLRDLRASPWCSIDNDDSRDLDQLTVAEPMANGTTRLQVAVAEVSATVGLDSALDQHARANTTSVYTPPQIFPMLPERLSTDLTSLNLDQDRLAMVVEMVVDAAGAITPSSAVPARLPHP